MKYKKGITYVETLVTMVILSATVLTLSVFGIKIKNKESQEDMKLMAFYNNVSAYEIIQKELNKTGDIDMAIKKATEETSGDIKRQIKTLIVGEPTEIEFDFPIYKITINTMVGIKVWEDISLTAFISPSSFKHK